MSILGYFLFSNIALANEPDPTILQFKVLTFSDNEENCEQEAARFGKCIENVSFMKIDLSTTDKEKWREIKNLAQLYASLWEDIAYRWTDFEDPIFPYFQIDDRHFPYFNEQWELASFSQKAQNVSLPNHLSWMNQDEW